MSRRTVVIDCAETLLTLHPAREEIAQGALARLGVRCELATIRTAYRLADVVLQARSSRERTTAQRAAFYTRYNALLAVALGRATQTDEIDRLLQEAFATRRHWVAAEGAVDAVRLIRGRYPTHVLANWSASLREVLVRAGLGAEFSGVFSSEELGSEKPLASAFHAFAQRSGVALDDCYYVGNDYAVDVVGSRAVGMEPLLLDRPGHFPDGADCPIFRHWRDVAAHLTETSL
jgi:putative hydrolase of the HAD superfamily